MTSRQFYCTFLWCADYYELLVLLIRRSSLQFVSQHFGSSFMNERQTKTTLTWAFTNIFRHPTIHSTEWNVIFSRWRHASAPRENNKLQSDIYVWHCDALTECIAFADWQTKHTLTHTYTHTKDPMEEWEENRWWIASVAHVATEWNGIDRTENQHLPNVGLMSF